MPTNDGLRWFPSGAKWIAQPSTVHCVSYEDVLFGLRTLCFHFARLPNKKSSRLRDRCRAFEKHTDALFEVVPFSLRRIPPLACETENPGELWPTACPFLLYLPSFGQCHHSLPLSRLPPHLPLDRLPGSLGLSTCASGASNATLMFLECGVRTSAFATDRLQQEKPEVLNLDCGRNQKHGQPTCSNQPDLRVHPNGVSRLFRGSAPLEKLKLEIHVGKPSTCLRPWKKKNIFPAVIDSL